MLIAVVGTGTGIGKTYVACALCRALVAAGLGVRALKPVESGVVAGVAADAAALAAAAGHEVVPPLYVFERAVSPHLEARRMGLEVVVADVADWVRRHGGATTLVETAGGLLSPLGRKVTNLDLVLALGVDRVVVVAPDRLGVLHDVGVVREVLVGRGLWARSAVVLSAPREADASTGTNGIELVALGLVQDVVVVGRDGGVERSELSRVLEGGP